MTTSVYDRLDNEVRMRAEENAIAEINEMAGLYEGILPTRFARFFPKNSPNHNVNLVRLAWDDLATQIGRIPDLRGEPQNNSSEEEKKIGKFEKIGHAYLRNAKPSGKIMLFQLAWWIIGGGRGVVVVTPDVENKRPTIGIRDPRTAYPNAKESAGNQIIALQDIIFKYELDVQEMENRGLAVKMQRPAMGPATKPKKGTVIEFIDEQNWIIASDGGTVQSVKHGMGRVPGWVFNTHAPNKSHGVSQFADQVTFMVAISILLSQKLRFANRLLHPIYWVKGYEGQIELGPDVINKLSLQGDMGQLNPPQQLEVDRDIELLTRFSRVLNRNPEVRQGEIASKGQYTSAKTLEQLAEAVDTVVGRIWDIISIGMREVLAVCFEMDEMLWPNVEKAISGVVRNQKFHMSYIPSKDIAGRRFLNVDYGFGLGGYQGFLQQVQAQSAGLTSKRRAMEQMPGVSDVDDLMREIELERIDDAAMANFEAQAAQGGLDLVTWAKLRREMARKGKPLFEMILKYEEELRKQAEAALNQGGADAVTTPAPEEQLGAPAGPPLPGISPSALIGV